MKYGHEKSHEAVRIAFLSYVIAEKTVAHFIDDFKETNLSVFGNPFFCFKGCLMVHFFNHVAEIPISVMNDVPV
ncbi:MAG: hypothetical protein A3C35_03650 [Omnitrophica bacterium RIFCSPHIGHO2_02_FULL_46_11]|nr:MAG: hypothetical protein A3A81_05875 [Omnitrophica bacterium RIFCSPLOWO2_01_FULL_45_10b]OGW87415.1 MAG: hypothetical protein A3C35_03650 [Omnitrophica bacterium RIFCSPHIGHO2_02_FULL_46_11]